MVPPAPDAGTSGALALQSNRVSVGDGLRCRETGFPGRRKKRQYVPRATDQRSQRRSGRSKPRRFGAFRTPAGNLRECGTAWWAREDSNLQPVRYEPIPPSASSGDCTSRIEPAKVPANCELIVRVAGRTRTSRQTIMSEPRRLRTERIFPGYGPRGLKLPARRAVRRTSRRRGQVRVVQQQKRRFLVGFQSQ
jgi:hypothetical protein